MGDSDEKCSDDKKNPQGTDPEDPIVHALNGIYGRLKTLEAKL